MNNNGQYVLLVAYLIGQVAVAVVAPLLTYFLTRPHLKKVESDLKKVQDTVANSTNGKLKS